ncbi:Uncharacterized protein TCAP_03365 [Tolypocladium capitatum]|uniref:Uncharacterized protein n=1 Tax=Tolypocladium capitatum TaxID=45235 RepID=A0A2K3QGM5_9HYPO|nr:Uncharacterized protein TCAP_03365 [Tolypocladium capitatum]
MAADPHAPQMEVAEPITPAGGADSASRKTSKNEIDWRTSRLADKHFNISKYAPPSCLVASLLTAVVEKYPDPLAPRQGVNARFYPKGVTPEMEKKWLAKIQALKDGTA